MQGSYCPSCEPAPPAPPPTATLRDNVEPAPPMPSEPLESSEPLEPLEPVVTLPPTSNVLSKVLDLAREIKGENRWIGYSAFCVFSILNSIRPFAWEGDTRVDLVANYATAFTDSCTKQPTLT